MDITRLAVGRFIPFGLDEGFRDQALEASEVESLFTILSEIEGHVDFELSCKDPLWAIRKDRDHVYSGCSVGNFLLDVLVDGTVLPCRRLPIPVGNMNQDRLVDVWLFSPLMRSLRNREDLEECRACLHINTCGGGCRGVAWGLANELLKRDPQCFLDSKPIKTGLDRRIVKIS